MQLISGECSVCFIIIINHSIVVLQKVRNGGVVTAFDHLLPSAICFFVATIEPYAHLSPPRDRPLSTANQSQLIESPVDTSTGSLVPATRPRDLSNPSDTESTRARKRQRIDSRSFVSASSIDQAVRSAPFHSSSSVSSSSTATAMRLSDSAQDSRTTTTTPSPDDYNGAVSNGAGPSSPSAITSTSTNGYTNGNGYTSGATNGFSTMAGSSAKKRQKSPISRVNLPGRLLYDDSTVDREEFVRLVIQSLRDVGYIESAATLEAESGYSMETSEVTQFRRYILEASWDKAEAALVHLGVTDPNSLWDAKFYITQQKYLELLEAQKTTTALYVLRNELAPMHVDPDHLHMLSSLIMSSTPADVRHRADWDGASGLSRQRLLEDLQTYIPASVMIPPRRFSTLLNQARSYQALQCAYHNSPAANVDFSLYTDHTCDRDVFPRVTTTILHVHTDEVWNIEWSHDGTHLASASKDKTAIIWRIGTNCAPVHVLRDHPFAVGCLAWSIDDTILLTSSDNCIKLWNVQTGNCFQHLDAHEDTVTALAWLPDGSGFISGSLDRKIIQWDFEGNQKFSWGTTAIRITDLAVTPDFTRLVAVGLQYTPPAVPEVGAGPSGYGGRDPSAPYASSAAAPGAGASASSLNVNGHVANEKRMIVYDLTTRIVEDSIHLDGEPSSVKISKDSRYALTNQSPSEAQLWDLDTGRLSRKYMGFRQGEHVIRSCFGGVDGSFVVSGSEDSSVYVWHRDMGTLLEILSGHGDGSVNSVAWNPTNELMFASCSDDNTIRIWETNAMTLSSSMRNAEGSGNGTSSSTLSALGVGDTLEMRGNGKGKTRLYWGEGAEF